MAKQQEKKDLVPAVLTKDNVKGLTRQHLIDKALELQEAVKAREGELVSLGDGAVFIRQDSRGRTMRAYRAEMKLDEKKNEIAAISGKQMITSGGAKKLNQVANIQIVNAPSVIVDGQEQPNPYIERAEGTRAIQSVWLRKVAIGPSPTGNMVAVDGTLYFNIYTYFLQDLQAKIKKYPECGTLGIRDKPPAQFTYQPRKWSQSAGGYIPDGKERTVDVKTKPMVFYPIEDPVGLWVDLSHPEIQGAFNEHVSRQKFGDRHAQSILERNILTSHPAVATKTVLKQGQFATAVVYGWRHDMSQDELSKMGAKYFEGKMGEDVEVVHQTHEVEPGDLVVSEEVGDEHGAVIDTEATVVEDEPAAEEPAAEEPAQEEETKEEAAAEETSEDLGEDPERSKLMGQVVEGAAILGKNKTAEILKKFFEGKKIEELTTPQLQVMDRKISEAVDQENA